MLKLSDLDFYEKVFYFSYRIGVELSYVVCLHCAHFLHCAIIRPDNKQTKGTSSMIHASIQLIQPNKGTTKRAQAYRATKLTDLLSLFCLSPFMTGRHSKISPMGLL